MKVTVIPQLPHKICVFIPREIVFTESFSPIGKRKPAEHLAVVWDEATAGRDVGEIASCFWHFCLKMRDAKNITIYVDNCAAQNKNWLLFCTLLRIVNDENFACESIELKYLVAGHTFMSADADHELIEKSLKKKKVIYDLDDFCESVGDTGISLTRLNVQDFLTWSDDVSRHQLQKLGEKRPFLKDVCHFEVIRGSTHFFFKNMFSDTHFQSFDVLKMNTDLSITQPKAKPRGISKPKKEKMNSSLLSLMPINRRVYWTNLPECGQSRDLLQSRDNVQTNIY